MKLKLPEHRTGMEQSVTYQAIVVNGEVKMAREILLSIGKRRLGPPTKLERDKINSIASPRTLKSLINRVMHVDSWQALEFPKRLRD
ncbi:MAG TPA: hypothetical protein VKX17_22225 [Planctomycetota bacterium]|nr:hypothetical protein [Planctomycetota bacterium]